MGKELEIRGWDDTGITWYGKILLKVWKCENNDHKEYFRWHLAWNARRGKIMASGVAKSESMAKSLCLDALKEVVEGRGHPINYGR